MNRLIEVDWAEIKSISNKFLENSNEIGKIADSFSLEMDKVKTNWTGVDSENYINNCQEIIEKLKEEVQFLTVWNDYLSKSSSKYNENVDNAIVILQNINNDLEG